MASSSFRRSALAAVCLIPFAAASFSLVAPAQDLSGKASPWGALPAAQAPAAATAPAAANPQALTKYLRLNQNAAASAPADRAPVPADPAAAFAAQAAPAPTPSSDPPSVAASIPAPVAAVPAVDPPVQAAAPAPQDAAPASATAVQAAAPAPAAPTRIADAEPASLATPTQSKPHHAPPSGGLLDINTASVEALNHLPGAAHLGRAIVVHRPYRSVSELKSRRILRESDFEKLRGRVKV